MKFGIRNAQFGVQDRDCFVEMRSISPRNDKQLCHRERSEAIPVVSGV